MDVVSIKETTKELKDSVEHTQVRRGEAEKRISDMEDETLRWRKTWRRKKE